jgi:large subunit ribosomal protein L24
MTARVKKGDTVVILRGDERGQRGTVHLVLPKEDKVVVAGHNIVKKHQKATGQQVRTQRGIIEKEAPLPLSKVAPVCRNNKCARFDKPVRVGFRMEDGHKVRFCRSCNEKME